LLDGSDLGSISEEKGAEALNSLNGDEEPGSNSSTVLSVKRAKGLLGWRRWPHTSSYSILILLADFKCHFIDMVPENRSPTYIHDFRPINFAPIIYKNLMIAFK